MAAARSIIRQDGEGEQLWFAGGGVFTMKATAAETGGAFSLFEDDVVRGKATPLHSHPNEDETIYVLDGELLVDMDGERHRVGKHGVFVAPRGGPHAFLVISETARLLCLQTPGTGEAFYRTASEPVSSPEDATRPPDFERLRAAASDSPTIELLGPPPFDLTDEPVLAHQLR
jgi:quercetin dioxygenase-like cupin family protein